MEISNQALPCTLGATLMAFSFAAASGRTRQLKRERILDYEPMAQVTDVAALDLDQLALESLLPLGTPDAMGQAMFVYTKGGFSGSYAILTLASPLSSATDFNMGEGTIVSGQSFEDKQEVRGVLMKPLTGGDTEVVVRYQTWENQRDYVGCNVGGSPNPILEGCFAAAGHLVVGDPEDSLTFNFDYSYNMLTENKNFRTLQDLSVTAKDNLHDCANCPYDTYEKYHRYYGAYNYGNEWIMAAFNRDMTNFDRGNADFSGYGDDEVDGIVEAIKKGTVFLNVYMEVIKSMEQAVDKCLAGEDSRVQSWDEAVAFYVGSIAKVTNGNEGNFLYSNAKKRCRNFGTCEENNGAGGEAKANTEIFAQFTEAQRYVFVGECEEVRLAKNRICDMMAVPLIQGTIRFAYLMGEEGIIDARSDVTSATFAASILPLVQSCSPVDAQVLYSNMRVGATSVSFSDVKSALDRNLHCMGLTCADVGGLVSHHGFLEGAEPCDDFSMVFDEVAQEQMVNATVGIAVPSQDTIVPTKAATTATTVQPTTKAPANLTFAPTTEIEEFAANTTSKINTTVTPLQILNPSPVMCPPCRTIVTSGVAAGSKSLSDCPILLVEVHWDVIGKSCQCACFVDSKFAFCAKESIVYTGSGTLVGPCEVELQGSLIDEDTAASVEGSVEATMKPAEPIEDYPPLSPSNSSNFLKTDIVTNTTAEEVEEEATAAPTVNLNNFNIAAAERQSSAKVISLRGFVAWATIASTAGLL